MNIKAKETFSGRYAIWDTDKGAVLAQVCAHNQDAKQLAELFAAAPEMLEALKAMGRAINLSGEPSPISPEEQIVESRKAEQLLFNVLSKLSRGDNKDNP